MGHRLSVGQPEGLAKRSQNAYIESFHDKIRDESLNREIFGSLAEARVVIGAYRREYNAERPHSSLGYRTPDEFATSPLTTLRPSLRQGTCRNSIFELSNLRGQVRPSLDNRITSPPPVPLRIIP